jgi:hypothetical protein
MINICRESQRSFLIISIVLLSACAGGSSGGTGATTAPAPAAPAVQAPAAPAKALPSVDTAAAQALLSPDQTLQTVSFPETGSTTVSGKIVGSKSVAYAVPAKAGQTLTVSLATKSTSAYVNVKDVRDQSGAAVHRGEIDGPKATIRVPADTTYLIDPFLVRAVARRGGTADYTLTIGRQ